MASDDVKIVVSAEDKATATLRQIQAEMGKFASTAKTLGAAAAGFITTGAVIDFARTSVIEYAKAEQAQIKLQSVLRATGNTTKLSQQQIEDFAQSIQNATGTEAEEVLDAASQLGRMSGIAGEQFKEILSLANDMETVLGGDMTSAAMQLTKALNSPAEGMAKLARSGIMFTEFQKETIKYLDETGKKAEAQAAILQEIRRQFGGAGAEFGDTVAGNIKQLEHAIGDLKEAIGEVLSPAIKDAVALIRYASGASIDNRDLGKARVGEAPAGLSAREQNDFYIAEVSRLAAKRTQLEMQAMRQANDFDLTASLTGFDPQLARTRLELAQVQKALEQAQERINRDVQSQTRNNDPRSAATALQRALQASSDNVFGGIQSLFRGASVNGVQIPSVAESGAAILLNGALGQWSPYAMQQAQQEKREQERRDNLPALAATEARFLQRGRGLLDPAAAAANKQVALLERIDNTLRRIENGDVILAAEAIG